MKKLLFIGLIFLSGLSFGIDRYGGQYNVIPDTSPYTFHYRLYVDPGKTGINDFEYLAMMDDIYSLWKDTQTSECSKWKQINMLLEKRVDIYITYPPGVSRSTIPFDSASLNVCEEGKPLPSSWSTAYDYSHMEAESGIFSVPMASATDTSASGGGFIESNVHNDGSATFFVELSSSSSYIIWARVMGENDNTDSFIVSVDGGQEDVFDVAEGTRGPNWQWKRVNGRGGTSLAEIINPRVFNLIPGTHAVKFKAREAYTGLDKIIVTNDLGFNPG